jgi:hypothetical protein
MTDSNGTTLPMVHKLWAVHEHACPHLRHDAHGCFCASPNLPSGADRYMPCEPVSLALWCLTEEYYTKCCLWPAGDVP